MPLVFVESLDEFSVRHGGHPMYIPGSNVWMLPDGAAYAADNAMNRVEPATDSQLLAKYRQTYFRARIERETTAAQRYKQELFNNLGNLYNAQVDAAVEHLKGAYAAIRSLEAELAEIERPEKEAAEQARQLQEQLELERRTREAAVAKMVSERIAKINEACEV